MFWCVCGRMSGTWVALLVCKFGNERVLSTSYLYDLLCRNLYEIWNDSSTSVEAYGA